MEILTAQEVCHVYWLDCIAVYSLFLLIHLKFRILRGF